MNATRLIHLVLVLGAGLGTACTTTIPIHTTQPGPVSVAGAKDLVLVKGEGRRSARESIAQELASQARAGGWFSVEDRSEDPVFARVAGGKVVVEDQVGAFADPGKTGVKVDILEWNAERSTERIEERDKHGRPMVREVPVHVGSVLLAVTVFDARGRAFVAEREYRGEFRSTDLDTTREQVVEQAGAEAVRAFLRDITPVRVVSHVRLDDDDPQQESIIATAKAGNVAQAAKDAQAYAEANPENPAAAYNLAVFLDAMGRHQEALTWYDRALRTGNKDFYVSARAECARRLAAQETLSATPAQ
ncbi:MAG TPA: tetratricopeptide repeat protein [Planctomycetota bacterium]|nr:tetratricopeptide repeat protein [Planctomycetota bacterium]